MKTDFDREINRKNTQSAKWGVIQDPDNPSIWHATDDYFGKNRILPLWVADMDFPAPRPVVDALVKRAQHGIYGYTLRTDSYNQAVVDWMQRRHGWAIDPAWISIPSPFSCLSKSSPQIVLLAWERLITRPAPWQLDPKERSIA